MGIMLIPYPTGQNVVTQLPGRSSSTVQWYPQNLSTEIERSLILSIANPGTKPHIKIFSSLSSFEVDSKKIVFFCFIFIWGGLKKDCVFFCFFLNCMFTYHSIFLDKGSLPKYWFVVIFHYFALFLIFYSYFCLSSCKTGIFIWILHHIRSAKEVSDLGFWHVIKLVSDKSVKWVPVVFCEVSTHSPQVWKHKGLGNQHVNLALWNEQNKCYLMFYFAHFMVVNFGF